MTLPYALVRIAARLTTLLRSCCGGSYIWCLHLCSRLVLVCDYLSVFPIVTNLNSAIAFFLLHLCTIYVRKTVQTCIIYCVTPSDRWPDIPQFIWHADTFVLLPLYYIVWDLDCYYALWLCCLCCGVHLFSWKCIWWPLLSWQYCDHCVVYLRTCDGWNMADPTPACLTLADCSYSTLFVGGCRALQLPRLCMTWTLQLFCSFDCYYLYLV